MANPPATDTVAWVSEAELKNGNSCFQCITVTPLGGNIPSFTAQLVSQTSGLTGTDLGVLINFEGVYSVSYTFLDCATSTKLIGSTSTSASPVASPTATAVATASPGASLTTLTSSLPTTSPTAVPTPTATAVTSPATTPVATAAATTAPTTAAVITTVAATTTTTSTNAPDGSAAEATCTGQVSHHPLRAGSHVCIYSWPAYVLQCLFHDEAFDAACSLCNHHAG